MPTPLEAADEALAAHTKHIGGFVNELGDLRGRLEASHEYEYQRGYAEGRQSAVDTANALMRANGILGMQFQVVQSCP